LDEICIEIDGQKMKIHARKLPVKITINGEETYYIHRAEYGGLVMNKKDSLKLNKNKLCLQ